MWKRYPTSRPPVFVVVREIPLPLLSLVKKPVPCTLTSFLTSCVNPATVNSNNAIVTKRPRFIILRSPFFKVRASVEARARAQLPARQRRNSALLAVSLLEHPIKSIQHSKQRRMEGHHSSSTALATFGECWQTGFICHVPMQLTVTTLRLRQWNLFSQEIKLLNGSNCRTWDPGETWDFEWNLECQRQG